MLQFFGSFHFNCTGRLMILILSLKKPCLDSWIQTTLLTTFHHRFILELYKYFTNLFYDIGEICSCDLCVAVREGEQAEQAQTEKKDK